MSCRMNIRANGGAWSESRLHRLRSQHLPPADATKLSPGWASWVATRSARASSGDVSVRVPM
eukprot:7671334-Pyramimonas_sp.AAC.1